MNCILKSVWRIILWMLPGFFWTACISPQQKSEPVKHIIEIKEMRFQPAEISIHAGDTVEWINKDFVDHDVTEENTKEWHSSALSTGKSWQWVITKNTNYYCSIHQVMKGKLIVQ